MRRAPDVTFIELDTRSSGSSEGSADSGDSNDSESSRDAYYLEEHTPKKQRVNLCETFRFASCLDWCCTILGAICSFISGGSSPLFMYLFGNVITSVYSSEEIGTITTNFALIMTCIGMGTLFLDIIGVTSFLAVASRQAGRLKCAFFTAVLNQDIAWHDEHKPGEVISRLTADVRVFQNGINDRLLVLFESLGLGVFGIVFAFLSCWELSLLILGALPIVAVVGLVIASCASQLVSSTRRQYAIASAMATEAIENIKTVQVFDKEAVELEKYCETLRKCRGSAMKKEFLVGVSGGAAMGIVFIVFGCAFVLASYLVRWGRVSAGDISSAFLSSLYGASGFGQIIAPWMSLTEARTAAYPLFEAIDRPPVIEVHQSSTAPCVFEESLEFRNVIFEYPSRPGQPIYKGLSFVIRKGEKVAFSGSTGCGKSTVIQLLQRFYDPTAGQVLVDGVDLRRLTPASWRDVIGIVSQDPALFSGSVLENIRVGRRSASLEDVVAACKQARIHDTICSLPRGYHTSVGAVGGQLSGGQKQRMAIARAIVRNCQLLLLDEATSALDRGSELSVQAALDDLVASQQMTVVTIAHRLTTIKQMDRIYFLDSDGDSTGSYLAEVGTYDELVRLNGRFASMAMMQSTQGGSLKTVVHDTSFYLYPTGTVDTTAGLYGANDVQDAQSEGFTGFNRVGGGGGGMSLYSPASGDSDLVSGSGSSFSSDTGSERSLTAMSKDEVPFEQLTDWEEELTEVSMCRLIRMTKSQTWAIAVAFVGSVLSALTVPLCALLVTQLITALGGYQQDRDVGKLNDKLWLYVPLLFGLAGVAVIAQTLNGFYGYVGEHLTYRLRMWLYEQVLRQDQTFFDMPRRDPGSLSGVLAGDCEAVHQLYGPTLGSYLKAIFSLGGGLVIALIFQWKVALVAMATVPLIVVGIILQQVFFTDEVGKQQAGLEGIVTEALSAVRTVHSFNMQNHMIRRFCRTVNNEQTSTERRCAIIGVIVGLTSFVSMASVALCFWFGGTLIAKGDTSFDKVMVAVFAVQMGTTMAGIEAGGFATKLRDARKAARHVFSIIDRVPDVDRNVTGKISFGETCNIAFDNVGFIYPARPDTRVLCDVNMSFADASSNGLMGQTGCGKSTVVQLLARFYNPTWGNITVNGTNLTDIDIATWRQSVSIVLQESHLFSGTIMENIRYSMPAATEAEVFEAAKIACIHDDILMMEEGYETQVGYRGRELSGGQRQRVAIARGVLRCPKLLLLDEATSALDNVTEAAVQRNLNSYQRHFDVTIISIAHRLTTIQHSDQIILLDSGKIIEQGNHGELMAMNGEYRSRWELTQ